MSLAPFGFTRTQDIVFWALARRGNATGYALALDTGIARANVYHALEVLAKRGLATASDGRPSTYQAVAAERALAVLAGEVNGALADLARRLGVESQELAPALQAGAGHVEIRGQRAALRESSQCVASASKEILAVVGPWVPELLPLFAEARQRGVSVRAVSLGIPAPQDAIVRDVPQAEMEAYWGGLPVAIVADRRRAVCCVWTPDGARGIATSDSGTVPFLRHLLRRELASAAAQHVS